MMTPMFFRHPTEAALWEARGAQGSAKKGNCLKIGREKITDNFAYLVHYNIVFNNTEYFCLVSLVGISPLVWGFSPTPPAGIT